MSKLFDWATITNVAPLRLRVDGDATELPVTPDSLLDPSSLAVGDRVRYERSGLAGVIVGRYGGLLASTTRRGLVELATDAEAAAATDTTRAVTPSNLGLSTVVGARRIFPTSLAKAGGGTLVMDPDGTARVTASGVTGISMNGIFEAEHDYFIDIAHFASVNQNSIFRLRHAGVDYAGLTYVQMGTYHTGSWTTGTETVAGYGQVTTVGLLSVNGRTVGRTHMLLSMLGSAAYWSMQTTTRDGGSQTNWAGTGDVSQGASHDGFSLLVGGGSFNVGTTIRVWELA